jgi:ATP-dependent DNA helicase DinG
MSDFPDDAVDALLDRLADAMGADGEHRPGQHEMARAVGAAIRRRRHLVVEAGTGTGKSLAYLVPPLALERRVVVATATKALQDQLAGKELPFLAEHLDRDVSWAVLKGRSNYLCLQRLDEVAGGAGQLELEGTGGSELPERQVLALRAWAARTDTGDRADLDVEPSERTWAAVSVGPRECPGAANCPRGEDCFAERARRRAAGSDVVVVNSHLYGLHLASDGMILPEHDMVVFDEAHEVPDIISSTTGLDLGPGRFTAAGRIAAGLIADDRLVEGLDTVAARLSAALAGSVGSRLRRGLPADVAEVLAAGRQRLGEVLEAVRQVDSSASADVATRVLRVQSSVGALVDDIDRVTTPPPDSVLWVSGDPEQPRLSLAPLDVGATLDELLWNPEPGGLEIVTERDQAPEADRSGPPVPDTVVFTSATIPPTLVHDLRIPADRVDVLDVGTPFDFEHQALLYCPTHLPDPRTPRWAEAMFDELARLIDAAGGRTLALFTSHRMMREAADALADRVDHPILRQGELPKPKLVERFAADDATCLFATMGYWQGIDVAGPSLSLVTIDKIPFPRPDDPLLQARREAVGASAFRVIDLPRAATLLAQGAGRLIRRRDDRGVVAVLDPRLATAKAYRWDLLAALPPMRRTKDLAEVAAFLAP